MPGFKPPSQFPGMDKLPGPVRKLTEMVFPQTPDLPTPMASAVGGRALGLASRAIPKQAFGTPLQSARDINPKMMDALYRESKRQVGPMPAYNKEARMTFPRPAIETPPLPPIVEPDPMAAFEQIPWRGVRQLKGLFGF